ncbi:hypothetical protein [Nonomuraea rhizosphaerae]|uniref:hypothetical protein n=1 Tax=Nonomuraea rhizosphaerae TaxID=2665663 RepID=UPI001C5CC946|nr:hypothetical protein [Nonomuraea rhizosphaerae]
MATGIVPTDKTPFTLRRATGTLAEGAAKLAAAIRSASVESVLANANRTAVRKGATGALGSMSPKPLDWYAFDSGDQETTDWYPQGLTCGEDSGSVSVPVFVASWYFKPLPPVVERGIRVTFLSPKTLKYQHALLVEAKPDGSYGAINIHAGGVAWHGDLLYVADTSRGLRVFDLRQVLDLRTAQSDLGDPKRIGRQGGKFHAFGYRYVIPQCDAWRVTGTDTRFSFVSIDRSTSPHTLITGEYLENDPNGRAVRYDLPLTGTPRDAFVMSQKKIQGGLSHGGKWYLSQAANGTTNGKLFVATAGTVVTRPFPIGPEDLTVQGGRLWSVTEFKNKRIVFAVAL